MANAMQYDHTNEINGLPESIYLPVNRSIDQDNHTVFYRRNYTYHSPSYVKDRTLKREAIFAHLFTVKVIVLQPYAMVKLNYLWLLHNAVCRTPNIMYLFVNFFCKLTFRIITIMIARASIISENEVSITVLCLLCSPRYTAVQIKNYSKSMSVIKVATARNTIVPRAPQLSSETEVSIALLCQLCSTCYTQEVFEKHLRIVTTMKIRAISRNAKKAITCNHQINAF